MNPLQTPPYSSFWKRCFAGSRSGHSLVEVTLALGIISSGLLTLIPLMTIGMEQTRQAQDNRMAAQIAQSFVEEARQGVLNAGTYYLDNQGESCSNAQAVYRVVAKNSVTSSGAMLLNLQIIPVGSPQSALSYAALTANN